MTATDPSSSPAGLWIDLDTLLDLPLEPNALAVVWHEVLDQQPRTQSQAERSKRQRLQDALRQLELQQAFALCEQGDWSTGLSKLEGLLADNKFKDEALAGLLKLLPILHYQLVDLAEESPSRCPYEEPERAELLWSSSIWLRRLNALDVEQPERMAAIREQIYRYGALAWMQRDTPQATRRSLTLLLSLSAVNPVAIPWSKPACTERLGQELETLELILANCEPSDELMAHVDELILLTKQFHEVFSVSFPNGMPSLQQRLIDIKACLGVWSQLKLS